MKVKAEGRVSNKAIYLAIGVNLAGIKEVLGRWASENEGAKFRLSIITELKNRGVKDSFIACVDGLKGFPEALETIYPKTQVQLCLLHLMRFSLACVSFKDRKSVAADLKVIYRAASAEEAEQHLAAFAESGLRVTRRLRSHGRPTGRELFRCSASRMIFAGPSIRPTR